RQNILHGAEIPTYPRLRILQRCMFRQDKRPARTFPPCGGPVRVVRCGRERRCGRPATPRGQAVLGIPPGPWPNDPLVADRVRRTSAVSRPSELVSLEYAGPQLAPN